MILTENDTAKAALPPVEATLVERLAREVAFGALRREFGFVPNFYRVISCSPLAFRAAHAMQELMDRHAQLSLTERHLVLLAVSAESECEYCIRFHCLMSASVGAAAEMILATRSRAVPDEPRVGALVRFAREVVRTRGKVDARVRAEFAAAGGSAELALEILTLVAFATLTNHTNHIARTPVDPAFRAMR